MLYIVSRGGNGGDDGIFIPLNVGIDAQENAPGCKRSRDTHPNNSEKCSSFPVSILVHFVCILRFDIENKLVP